MESIVILGSMHIELNRTFHELSRVKGSVSDEVPLFPSGDALSWNSLLDEHRIVVLSEAGTGKTHEIREVAKNLRKQDKAAFFLRLEHVAVDFDSAFEEGTLADFELWISSADEGWIFLDSVDEARLRSPADFELAIKKLSARLAKAKQRTHLVITARTSAWRPITDLDICSRNFPYLSDIKSLATGQTPVVEATSNRNASASSDCAFRIVSLDNLTRGQIEVFASNKGVTNVEAFLDAVERADALRFCARPQDLDELIEFWIDAGRIGSRLELMRNSIARRLKERDQTRDEARPLTTDQARNGVRCQFAG